MIKSSCECYSKWRKRSQFRDKYMSDVLLSFLYKHKARSIFIKNSIVCNYIEREKILVVVGAYHLWPIRNIFHKNKYKGRNYFIRN